MHYIGKNRAEHAFQRQWPRTRKRHLERREKFVLKSGNSMMGTPAKACKHKQKFLLCWRPGWPEKLSPKIFGEGWVLGREGMGTKKSLRLRVVSAICWLAWWPRRFQGYFFICTDLQRLSRLVEERLTNDSFCYFNVLLRNNISVLQS